MNAARVASLLRELADALEEGDGKTLESRRKRESKRPRRPLSYPPPLNPVSDTDRMAARRMLKKLGLTQ